MSLPQLLGITQRAPRVIERGLYCADQIFADGQTPGQGTGQGAARAVIAARQAMAGKGVAATIATVEAIMDFVFIAVFRR